MGILKFYGDSVGVLGLYRVFMGVIWGYMSMRRDFSKWSLYKKDIEVRPQNNFVSKRACCKRAVLLQAYVAEWRASLLPTQSFYSQPHWCTVQIHL